MNNITRYLDNQKQNKKKIIIFTIFISLTLVIMSCKPKNHEQLVNEAKINIQNEEYDRAKDLLKKALEQKKSKEAYKELGNLYLLAEANYDLAEQFYILSLSLDEDYINSIHNMGLVYIKKYESKDERNFKTKEGHIETAIKWFQKALEKDKNFELSHIELSRCYLYKKDFKKSIDYIENAINLNENNPISFSLAGEIILSTNNNYKQALEYFEKSYAISNSIPETLFFLAKTHKKLGNEEKSSEYYKIYIELLKRLNTPFEIIKRAEAEQKNL
ncbi:MAG: hypothetical protein OEZ22_08310 [Spirochaetia bacterium]|nr:hypothetical protein [Spirochaetia bacterium]